MVRISAKEIAGGWKFFVQDNGIGMTPDQIGRLFVIFHRLHDRNKFSGSGIGLATCKRIVERHGGTIHVESKVGEGSIFTFTIPARHGAAKGGGKST